MGIQIVVGSIIGLVVLMLLVAGCRDLFDKWKTKYWITAWNRGMDWNEEKWRKRMMKYGLGEYQVDNKGTGATQFHLFIYDEKFVGGGDDNVSD